MRCSSSSKRSASASWRETQSNTSPRRTRDSEAPFAARAAAPAAPISESGSARMMATSACSGM